jgi:hypothetical protein
MPVLPFLHFISFNAYAVCGFNHKADFILFPNNWVLPVYRVSANVSLHFGPYCHNVICVVGTHNSLGQASKMPASVMGPVASRN